MVILGDFNEVHPVGSPDQAVAVLFKARPRLIDALTFVKGKARTHADGKAYDRVFLSQPIVKGTSGLKFESTSILEHRHGKGEQRRVYTDHFPVCVLLRSW